MIKYTLLLLALVVGLNCVEPEPRKVSVEWNPGCDGSKSSCNGTDDRGSYTNLVHVQFTGTGDIVHLLYSDIDAFTIMFARTNLTTKLTVDWLQLLSHNRTNVSKSLSFTEKPLEWFSYEVATIYEFNDANGTADMSKYSANETVAHLTKEFVWKKFQFNETENFGWFEGSEAGLNGTYKFVVNYPGKEKRDTDLPHLLLNPESTSIDFVVDSVVAKYNHSKFALNVILSTNEANVVKESKRSLDDEYTPGTFRLWSVESKDESNAVKSFLQWKPIFYYFSPKSLENSTITREYELHKNDSSINGIGLAFFNIDTLYPALNISFGLPGDDKSGFFYKETSYSSFTFSVGFGAPPEDKMSGIVTLVIIVGFGLPAIVILVGLVVLLYRKIFRSDRKSVV